MPAHFTLPEIGYRIRIRPADRLHRTGFPFYFQHTNPRFVLEVQREKGAEPAFLTLKVVMPEGEPLSPMVFNLEEVPEGKTKEFKMPQLVVLHPGHVTMFAVKEKVMVGSSQYREPLIPLYSFEMRSTEALWLATLTACLILGSAAIGANCQPRVPSTLSGAPPIIQLIVPTSQTSPTTTPTPATMTPPP